MRLQVEAETPKDLVRHYADVRRRLNEAKPVKPTARLTPVLKFSVPGSFIGGIYGVQPWLNGRHMVSNANIIRAVIKYFQLPERDFFSSRRTKELVTPRQLAMYLCKEMTGASYPVISRHMNRMDHTTSMHGHKKIKALIVKDASLQKAAAAIRMQFMGVAQ